jgi:hypothetical protein
LNHCGPFFERFYWLTPCLRFPWKDRIGTSGTDNRNMGRREAGSMSKHLRPRTLAQIFYLPAVLAAITLLGLLSALFGDGAWDALSWVALACPIAATVYFVLRSRRAQLR